MLRNRRWTGTPLTSRDWLWLVVAFAALSPAKTAAQEYNPPLDAYVDTETLPADLLSPSADGGPPPAQRVQVKLFEFGEIAVTEPAATEPRDIGARIVTDLVLTMPLRLDVAGMESGFAVEIGTGEFHAEVTALGERLADLPAGTTGSIDLTTIEDVAYKAEITAVSLPIDLVLSPEFFKPMKKDASGIYAPSTTDSDGDGAVDPARLRIQLIPGLKLVVAHSFDGETNVSFESGPSGSFPTFSLADAAVMLGESGVVLDISEIAIDLSDSASPATVVEGPAWKGVVLQSVSVAFTNGLDSKTTGENLTSNEPGLTLALQNFQIGTGGIGGSISGSGLGFDVDLFGLVLTLDTVDLRFQQNALVGSRIVGIVQNFPFFEKDVKLELALDLNGNFKAGIAADDPNRDAATGLVKWDLDGAVALQVDSVAFEVTDRIFYTTVNGSLELLFLSGGGGVSMEPGQDVKIPVNNLRISSKGEVSLDGGWVTLPEKRYLDFNAFRVELSQLGFGVEDTKRWIGFSGGVELVEGLASNAKFKKLQFIWQTGSSDVTSRLEGVEVGFEKPGVVSFQGAADWFEDNSKKGFAGKLSANLEFIKLAVSSRIVIGETIPGGTPAAMGTCDPLVAGDPFKFFYLDLQASLPAGIPVFSNVSIYGFSGLLAVQMEPNICAFDKPLNWFKAHLAATNVVDGNPPPWSPREDAFAVGLGVMVGTTADNGFTINTKVALTVAIPGPVVMLSGQGNIIKERGDLLDASDPFFLALAIFDGRRPSFLLNLGVYYKIPDDGLLIDLAAEAEAFFNLTNPNDWHLYLGKKDPESERIRATILKFLRATAYYMIDPAGFAFGAKTGYDSRPNWKFGPLRVQLAAWMGYDASLSWRPVQAWGSADLGGLAELKAFGFGVGLSAHALLEVSSPTPYFIDGKFTVKLKLPWPLPDPKATVHLRWEEKADPAPVENLVARMGLEASKETVAVAATPARNTSVAPGHTIPTSSLCSPWESLPVKPEIDEDNNANGVLDPGEDLDGDGVLTKTRPVSTCTPERPLVPVNYRPVTGFERSTNQALVGADQPQLVGNVNGHEDKPQDTTFRYDLTALKLWAAPLSTTGTETFNSVLPEVYGVWPTYLGNPERPAALSVKLWSKNPFSIYDASTFIVFNGTDPETWPDWVAGIYGEWPCPPKGEGPKPPPPPDDDDNFWTRLWKWLSMGAVAQPGPADKCFDPSILEQKDLILPPYHAFAMAAESEVAVTGPGTAKSYRDVGYFYTQGAPLALDEFVEYSVPASLGFPLYRSYRVGLRFNETYLDLLYKEPGSVQELLYKDPQQKFVFEIVDEDGRPAADADGNIAVVTTEWSEAPDHIDTRNDQALIELLQSKGILVGVQPTDDMVYGWPNAPAALKPGVRYTARAWFEDKRLIGDTRAKDSIWLRANKVRTVDGQRVLLFEHPFVASTFERFADVASAYEGSWFPLESGAYDAVGVSAVVTASAARSVPPATVGNGSADFIGWHLAHGRPDLSPDAASSEAIADAVERVPGYAGDIILLTPAEVGAIQAAWSAELQAFTDVSAAMGIDRTTEPLPEKVEISVVSDASDNRALLLELPEGLEWTRITTKLEFRPDSSAAWAAHDSAVVADAKGARAFVFDSAGGSLQPLADGEYRVTLTYKRDIGSRMPVHVRTDPATGTSDGLAQEEAVFTLAVPGDMVTAEANP